MGLYDQVKESFEDIIDTYKQSVTDGKLSFSDALTLTYNATATFVRITEGLGRAKTGSDKKDIVLLAIGRFYDIVIRPLPITGLPGPLEDLADAAFRSLILTMASAWIDAMVNVFAKLGWVTAASSPVTGQPPAKLIEPIIF